MGSDSRANDTRSLRPSLYSSFARRGVVRLSCLPICIRSRKLEFGGFPVANSKRVQPYAHTSTLTCQYFQGMGQKLTASPHFHICELRLELRTFPGASSEASQSRLIACPRATGVHLQHRNRRSEAVLPRGSICSQLQERQQCVKSDRRGLHTFDVPMDDTSLVNCTQASSQLSCDGDNEPFIKLITRGSHLNIAKSENGSRTKAVRTQGLPKS